MKVERVGSEVLHLPRLGNVADGSGMFDNLSKLFYPHYNAHQNSIHYEEPKRARIHPRSKSVVSIEASMHMDPERLMMEENDHSKVLEERQSVSYEKRMQRFKSRMKSPSIDLVKPIEDILMHRLTPKLNSRHHRRRIGTPARMHRKDSSLRKLKEASLKAALTVQKPKVETVESRIRSIVQDIFPLTSEIALGQFIERFDQMRSLVKVTKDEQKRVDKITKSEKHEPSRKAQILREKKRKFEVELQNEYDALFKKHFQPPGGTSKESEELFRRKFRKHIRALSKTLILDKNA